MLIDLHIHTKQGSRCSSLDIHGLVMRAKKMHLDAVCITDHNTTMAVEMVRDAGKEQGLIVLGGMEVRCREGDILTFGLQDPPDPGIAALDLLKLVQRSEGAAIVAHPFRASAPSLGRVVCEISGFDALEVLNGNSSNDENKKACCAAQRLHIPGTGGSDAHSRASVGRYVTEFEENSIKGEQDLIAALRGGRFKPKKLLDL